jgi:hypothetical protein
MKKSRLSQKREDNIRKSKCKSKRKRLTSGCIVNYTHNKHHDKFVMDYVSKEPKTSILVIFPTITLTTELRNKLYAFIHDHCNIKIIKKIKLNFDDIVQLLYHFNTYNNKDVSLINIKRSVMLDMSWAKDATKTIYVIVLKQFGQTNLFNFNKQVNKFFIDYEFDNIANSKMSRSMSYKKSDMSGGSTEDIVDNMSDRSTEDIVDNMGVITINSNNFPFKTQNNSEEEITMQFLNNVVVNKIYIKLTHTYHESVHFSKILFGDKLFNHKIFGKK